MFSGLFDLPVWGLVLVAVVLTQITIASVTIYLHRHQAHRALDLHPIVSHFFRFWLWLTTGMITREWAAIHRKHHAKCETEEDPHSPQVLGLNRVLFGGVFLYIRESFNQETLQRYGHGTPDDWLEHRVYTPLHKYGILLMLAIDLLCFGLVPGALIWGVQMLWVPFWAAGVINGLAHFWGYRNFAAADASRNLTPLAFFIGGEELHNNHHAFATSARFSAKWYEFDIGWMYIRVLSALKLASVKKVIPRPRFVMSRPSVDLDMLQAVVTHRYDVMRRYMNSLRESYAQELARLREQHGERFDIRKLRRWLHADEAVLPQTARAKLQEALAVSPGLAQLHRMRTELEGLWARSSASGEQLVKQLQDWCSRAEQSGLQPLRDFSMRLRSYAV